MTLETTENKKINIKIITVKYTKNIIKKNEIKNIGLKKSKKIRA